MRLPIFQLTFKISTEGLGLVFPSELPYDVQDFGFFLPVPQSHYHHNWLYPEILFDVNEYYFPVEVDGEYRELYAATSFKDPYQASLNFNMNNQNVEFVLASEMSRPYREYFRYTGEYQSKSLSQFRFYELKIADIAALNRLYNHNQGIFVGFTREFGEFFEDFK